MRVNIFSTFLWVVAVSLFSNCSGKTSCDNTILNDVQNFSNTYKIVEFERDCGATTGTSTQISILKSSEKLSTNDGGNIFISTFVSLETIWMDDSTVVIKIPDNDIEIFKKDTTAGIIRVRYEKKT